MQPAYAVSTNLVVSQVQLGNVASANNEFVEVYNNNTTDTEITNWCLYYASASSVQIGSKMTCFISENDNIHLYLPGHSFAFAISNQLFATQPSLGSDLKFSATLSGAAGHVRLIDGDGLEIDKVGWGTTAISAEGSKPIAVPSTGKILSRKILFEDVLQDTDINGDDFEITSPKAAYLYGSIYEIQDVCDNIAGIQATIPSGYSVDTVGDCIPPPIDVCFNMDGLQIVVPVGYSLDEGGECLVDVCQNISGLQTTVPNGLELDENNNCIVHDECSNLLEIQAIIPSGYKRSDENNCVLDLLPLNITELLPNAIDSDDGNEFIEIYNSNDIRVDLSNYKLLIGTNENKYSFPVNSWIDSNQYLSFSNYAIKFTLVNTTSKVKLVSSDDQLIDETPAYSDPDEGMAWALIDGLWQYTNRPTQDSVNVSSLFVPESEINAVNNLMPCAANQYRNPETNRCRLLVTSSSTLTPCKDGQYRSEETNRCRSIAKDVSQLVPCAEGQERNPATNRCRSTSAVLGAKELTPCKAGQERNPETNRCRNVVSAIPAAGYAPEQANQFSNNNIVIWSLVAVGAVAICYGIWEWRQEIIGFAKKIRMNITGKT